MKRFYPRKYCMGFFKVAVIKLYEINIYSKDFLPNC